MSNKEKIVLIINESLKCGRKTKYQYGTMFEAHRRLCDIVHLKETIEEKTKLFLNIDESSELYKSIYLSAKMALIKMQSDECYNFYCAELLMKIFSIEDIFERKLKSIKHEFVDATQLKKQTTNEIIENEQTNELTGVELVEKREHRISGSTTGKKFLRETIKRKDIVNALLNNKL